LTPRYCEEICSSIVSHSAGLQNPVSLLGVRQIQQVMASELSAQPFVSIPLLAASQRNCYRESSWWQLGDPERGAHERNLARIESVKTPSANMAQCHMNTVSWSAGINKGPTDRCGKDA